ncbi:MAG: hypothetical protein HYV32_01930 [Candidatus Kerfeldbacteria bacterium]|nr:hypothetical protein [Candidatus Kerfeldbacteria bacterium]
MYFYFYDKFIQDQKYQAALNKMETRLIDLGINGRIEKLSIFKNAKELIEDSIKHGAQTIVAVGNDKTFATLVNIIAPFNVALGFIPFDPDSRFAQALGMPIGEEACSVISRRRYTTLDVGKIGTQYFLGSVRVIHNGTHLSMRCDRSYSIQSTNQMNEVRILNMGDIVGAPELELADAADGRLTIIVEPLIAKKLLPFGRASKKRESLFLAQHVDVQSTGDAVTLSVDGIATVNTPCTVEIIPQGIKVIVGPNRKLRHVNE